MSWSIRQEEQTAEFFDTPAELRQKVKRVAQLLQNARYAIAFTGAGISTSIGIPDFRSGMQTKVKTGPGFWELSADYERKHGNVRSEATKNDPKRPRIDLAGMADKQPSYTHRCLAKLVELGKLKFVISQNVDNLHRRSGIPPSKLSEMHGNLFVEVCPKCNTEYARDFLVGPNPGKSHFTGRFCDYCPQQELKDFLVPFGEDLPLRETRKAWDESEKADLCLALGSSLTVTPACDYGAYVCEKNLWSRQEGKYVARGKLCVFNMQKTPYFKQATDNVFAFCDDAMRILMEELGIVIEDT